MAPEAVIIEQSSPTILEIVAPVTQVVQIVDRGPVGPQGPIANQDLVQEYIDEAVTPAVTTAIDDYFVLNPKVWQHDQPSPSTDWQFIHPYPYPPEVVVQDTAGEVQEGVVTYPSSNTIGIEFTVTIAGTAFAR